MKYILTYCTESGDRDVFGIESKKPPTSNEVDTILYGMMPREYEECGGVDWEIEKAYTQKIPSKKLVSEYLKFKEEL